MKWAWYEKLCLQHSSYEEVKDEDDTPAPQKESTSSGAVTWGINPWYTGPVTEVYDNQIRNKVFTSPEAKLQQL